MKKVFKLFSVIALAGASLFGCGGKGDKVIKIQFVPSQQSSEIMLKTKALEGLLADRIPGYKFEISVGTDYNAVVEAMQSKQIHVGFLTAQQYAYATVDRPGTAEVLLTSVRAALEVQLMDDEAEIIAAMNAPGYTGQKSETETVTSYRSILIVKSDSGLNTLEDMKGKKICTQATTSGAGYVYPSVLLDQNGMKFTNSSNPSVANGEVQSVNIGSYPSAVTGVMDGNCDGAFIFQDARDNATLLATYPNLFTDTKVIALTPGIYNDTISVIPSLDKDLKIALQEAFIDIATTEVGLLAISVYSHTGYKVAHDEDYEGERTVYRFKKEHLDG